MDRLMYEPLSADWYSPNGVRYHFAYRNGTNDANTITSCVTEDEYALQGLDLKGWVLDIGGYLGCVGIVLAKEHPDLEVVIVEPVPENAELCRENAKLNDVEGRVRILEAAIGAPGQGKAEVAYAYTGSELALHHAWVGNASIIAKTDCTVKEVPAFSLAEIMKLIGEKDPPSLVKIDCEGGEWTAWTDPMFRKVPIIRGEWHNTASQTRKDVQRMLKAHDVTFAEPESGPAGFDAVLKS